MRRDVPQRKQAVCSNCEKKNCERKLFQNDKQEVVQCTLWLSGHFSVLIVGKGNIMHKVV